LIFRQYEKEDRHAAGQEDKMPETDRDAITSLINLYALAVDSQRWELFDRLFTANVVVDYGEGAIWTERDSFKKAFASIHAPLDSTQHIMSGHQMRIIGDEANAFTYGAWTLMRYGADGGDTWRGSGWYDDQLVRAPDGWRIRHRTCRVIAWFGNPVVQGIDPAQADRVIARSSIRHEGERGRIAFLRSVVD
jgi:hypothetical protein